MRMLASPLRQRKKAQLSRRLGPRKETAIGGDHLRGLPEAGSLAEGPEPQMTGVGKEEGWVSQRTSQVGSMQLIRMTVLGGQHRRHLLTSGGHRACTPLLEHSQHFSTRYAILSMSSILAAPLRFARHCIAQPEAIQARSLNHTGIDTSQRHANVIAPAAWQDIHNDRTVHNCISSHQTYQC